MIWNHTLRLIYPDRIIFRRGGLGRAGDGSEIELNGLGFGLQKDIWEEFVKLNLS
jgi:hypothetical protein